MVVARQVFFEPLRPMFTLGVQPRQVRLGVLSPRLVLGRLPCLLFLRKDHRVRFRRPVHKTQSLHTRVGQVILLLVLVKDREPLWLGRLKKVATALDRRFFTLNVPGASGAGNIRNLVPGVIDDDILVVAQKVGVQKVLDRLDGPVLVRLLFDKDSVGRRAPWLGVQVMLERRKQTVGMLGRNAADVPLVNLLRSSVHKAHGQIFNSDINR